MVEKSRLINDRYRPERLLGQGGMGEVFLVEDLLSSDKKFVALKSLSLAHTEQDRVLQWFKQEFHTLTTLHHPGLAEVYDFGRDRESGKPFYTAQYVDGPDLFAGTRSRKISEVIPVLLRVCQALDYLHTKGVLHNDLKTSNILIETQTDQPKILDFGLSDLLGDQRQAKQRRAANQNTFHGTLIYAAPELIRGEGASFKTDLYALGMIFFKVLAGRLPQTGKTPGAIARENQAGNFPSPRSLNKEIPAALEEMILALVAKDPADRPTSVTEVENRLAFIMGQSAPQISVDDALGYAQSVGIIGRERALHVVKHFVRAKIPSVVNLERMAGITQEQSLSISADWNSEAERPGFFVLEGQSGLGKTLLLQHFKRHYQLEEVPFLLAQCHAHAPVFAPWKRLFAEMGTVLSQNSKIRGALGSSLEDVFGQVQHADRTGLFLKLSALLASAFEEKPFVLALDNLDDGDELTLAFLEHLARLQKQGKRLGLPPVLLAVRKKEKLAALLEGNLSIGLPPLTFQDCHLLLQRALVGSPVPEKFSRRLHERSDGNPFFIQEILHDLITKGVLTRRRGEWNLAALDVDRLSLPESLSETLKRHYESLDKHQRTLLQCIALYDGPVASIELQRLLEEGTAILSASLEKLVQQEILQKLGNEMWSFDKTAFREWIQAATAGENARRLHLQWAAILEKYHPERVEKLAFHFAQGGSAAKAALYACQAAALCQRQFAQERALRFYEEAFALATGDAEAAASEIPALCGMAEVFWQMGNRAKAIESYERLLARSQSGEWSDERAKAFRALGIAHRGKGDYARAVSAFRQGVDELGRRDPIMRATLNAQIALVYQQEGNAAESKQWREQSLALLMRNQALHAQSASVLLLIATVLTRSGDRKEAKDLYTQALELARKQDDRRLEAAALNNLGSLQALCGDYVDARETLSLNLTLCRQMSDAARTCGCLDALGKVEYSQGHYHQAFVYLLEAMDLARTLADGALLASIQNAMGQLEVERGHYAAAKKYLDEAKQFYQQKKDRLGLARVSLGLAQALNLLGRYKQAAPLCDKARAHLDDPGLEALLLITSAQTATWLEDYAAADAQLKRARELSQKLANTELSCDLFLAEAELLLKQGSHREAKQLMEEAPTWKRKIHHPIYHARLDLLKLRTERFEGEAAALAPKALRLVQTLSQLESPDLLWRAHYLLGALLQSKGELSEAIGSFRSAEEILRQLRVDLDDESRQAFLNDSEKQDLFAQIHRLSQSPEFMSEELKLSQEYNRKLLRLLEVNRQLAARWQNRSRLLDYIIDMALELTGARRGFLILRGATNQWSLASARTVEKDGKWEPEKAWSRTIVEEVFASGLPKKMVDALGDGEMQESKSVVSLALRSVLCVPMRLGGQVLGVLYVDNDKAEGAFERVELSILASLADQAILALHQTETQTRQQQEIEETSSELQRTQLVVQEQNKSLEWKYTYAQIIGGKSEGMRQVFALLDRVIPSQVNVLIQGESGTGKELVARAIHHNGPRKDKPFISINCGGLSPHLLESELFGHVKGSFTGADKDREGLLAVANGGTVFLDEVVDMPLELQAKVLRTTQDGEIRPVGSDKSIHVDIRILAASKLPLQEQVAKGVFREDLYYRLNVVQIDLPPLRKRSEDMDLLIDVFLKDLAKKVGGGKRILTPKARKALHDYAWPGNVRQLYNTLEGVIATHQRSRIDFQHLPALIQEADKKGDREITDFETARDTFVKGYVQRIVEHAKGNVSVAARNSRLSRQYIYKVLGVRKKG